nr:glycosyltransferase [uncultured Moellerella sp.]
MNKEHISICVISYNSEKTIIETLESIFNQNYGSRNIELIISDDCSTDKTIVVIEKWIELHKNDFLSISLLKNDINVGISKNINQTWKKATSKWIKSIAGDDTLKINCISSFVKYVNNNLNCRCVFSIVELFNSTGTIGIYPKKGDYYLYELSADKQFIKLLTKNYIRAPGSFIQKSLLAEFEFANENFKNLEDYPLWLKFTSHAQQIQLHHEILVSYRVEESLSNSKRSLFNLKINSDIIKCIDDSLYIIKNKNKFVFYMAKIHLFILKLTSFLAKFVFKNKKNKLTSSVIYILRSLSPLKLLNILK